jgi:Rieske Fe-S protein
MRRRKSKADQAIDAVIDGRAVPEARIDDPEDMDALRAAIELRAASPAADLPSDHFVADLRRRLIDESAPATPQRGVSRRALIASAGAVAAGVAGAVVDRNLLSPSGTQHPVAAGDLVPDSGTWTPVATEADIAGGAVHRFATPTVVGFVTQRDGAPAAVSGVCTHLGCLLQENAQAGRLDCPCHRTSFGLDGKVLFSQLHNQPAALPRIQARRQDGNIEVWLPRA